MIWVFTGMVRCVLAQMFQRCNEPSSQFTFDSADQQLKLVHRFQASLVLSAATTPRPFLSKQGVVGLNHVSDDKQALVHLNREVLTPLAWFCSHSTWTVQVLFLFIQNRIKKCFQLPFFYFFAFC